MATCTGVPLEKPSVVTTAVKLPRLVGAVVMVTVSEVADVATAVPAAPLLKRTVLVPDGSNPVPVMVSVVALTARLAVLLVTTGGAPYV